MDWRSSGPMDWRSSEPDGPCELDGLQGWTGAADDGHLRSPMDWHWEMDWHSSARWTGAARSPMDWHTGLEPMDWHSSEPDGAGPGARSPMEPDGLAQLGA
ncbi:hypothetical protein CYMTET_26485 [Cymbomonas tetramitiformis]|uniref:Uncharacterized protein n=1 Tax=Cymbomonas tetramitiformis TaxID=36881 RepID=A0AAE0FSG2_9CHLO|nr:hypothetical protein CYMTET_26485 [Cymbomonas tetramitiformis]